MKRVTQAVNCFLKNHHNGHSPLLVAVSGGGDSLTLLHALSHSPFKKFFSVIHVDHQWRKESSVQADGVKETALSWGFPCQVVKVERQVSEDLARHQRLSVYKKILEEKGGQAVLLAHHRGDQAETVFKRLMEGSSLTKLMAIQPVTRIEGVCLWRPLLSLPKSSLTSPPLVDDPTNQDPAFYRSRLRVKIFPYLEKALGRPLESTFARFASQAASLTDYLNQESAPYLTDLTSPFLDLTSPPHPFLCAHIIRRFCEAHGVFFSRESLDNAVELVFSGVANKRVEKGGVCLHIDCRHLTLSSLEESRLKN